MIMNNPRQKVSYVRTNLDVTMYITAMFNREPLRDTIIVLKNLSVLTTKPVKETSCASKNLSAS